MYASVLARAAFSQPSLPSPSSPHCLHTCFFCSSLWSSFSYAHSPTPPTRHTFLPFSSCLSASASRLSCLSFWIVTYRKLSAALSESISAVWPHPRFSSRGYSCVTVPSDEGVDICVDVAETAVAFEFEPEAFSRSNMLEKRLVTALMVEAPAGGLRPREVEVEVGVKLAGTAYPGGFEVELGMCGTDGAGPCDA